MDDDFELVRRWQAGDEEAGDALVRRHFWSVYRFFRSKVDDAAEDLAQRTFLACVEARERVRPEQGFVSYLFGIARNQLLMHLRRHGRSSGRFEPLETSVADLQGDRADDGLAQHEQQRALLGALRRIPVDFQIAVELYYWEELSVSQVAAVLDVAPGTVKSRLARARDKLREQLERMALPETTLHSTLSDLEGWARSLRDAQARGPSGQADDGSAPSWVAMMMPCGTTGRLARPSSGCLGSRTSGSPTATPTWAIYCSTKESSSPRATASRPRATALRSCWDRVTPIRSPRGPAGG